MKLSGWQLFWTMATLEISMSIWLTISPTIRSAKQDAWISLIVAGLIGLAVTFLSVTLCRQHPTFTLVEVTQFLFGKWGGKLVSLFYFTAWYMVAATILRDFSEFIQQTLFHNTPSIAISIVMIVATMYINFKGNIVGIARISELVGPLVIVGILLTFAFNMPNLQLSLLLPVYADTGVMPILKGSLYNASFLGESILLLMLTPFLSKPESSMKPSLLAIVVPTILAVACSVFVIATFGTQLGGAYFTPYFIMVRFISFLDFIQNMDVWIIFIWIFSVFVKLSVYLFINSYGSAQVIGVKNWRKMIWFVAPIVLVLSHVPLNSIVTMEFADRVWIKYVLPIHMVALPTVMILFGYLRKRSLGTKNIT